jgi:hypothetical protein
MTAVPRRTGSIGTPLAIVGLAACLLTAGCDLTIEEERASAAPSVIAPTQVDLPAGVAHRMTPVGIADFVRREVASMEASLGRVLTPLRIRRIRLLRPGEEVAAPMSDGKNPTDRVMAATDRPAWMVEADGTFFSAFGSRLGRHAYFLIDDDPNPSWSLEIDPCWERNPPPDAEDRFDGECDPP